MYPRPVISKLVSLGLLLLACQTLVQAQSCNKFHFGPTSDNNIVCYNDPSTECSSLAFTWPHKASEILLAESNQAGARFNILTKQIPATQSSVPPPDYVVRLQLDSRLQKVEGFGGAFTDSACKLIMGLPENVRKCLFADYYSASGLDYSMGRLPIGGTDMSTRPYSYDDLDSPEQSDFELTKFKLQPEDLELKIPAVQIANELRQSAGHKPLKLLASSWSAPAWMKSNGELLKGHLEGPPNGPFYDAYARYLVKFLHEYEAHNVKFWALSPQNEPRTPTRLGPKHNFNAVVFEPEELADFLNGSLVPAMLAAGKIYGEPKLLIWEDTLDDLEAYQRALLAMPRLRAIVKGLAIHWYSLGLHNRSYSILYQARRMLPDRYFMLSTEASFLGGPKPGKWAHGERYARDLIENLRVGSISWVDWNLALNMSGGPTWCGNVLDAAVLIDPDQQRYYKNPTFFSLAHVSKFVAPGSSIVVSQIEIPGTDSPLSLNETLALDVSLVASEQPFGVEPGRTKPIQLDEISNSLIRRYSLVVQNRASTERRLQIVRSGGGCDEETPINLVLTAKSITSLAFVC